MKQQISQNRHGRVAVAALSGEARAPTLEANGAAKGSKCAPGFLNPATAELPQTSGGARGQPTGEKERDLGIKNTATAHQQRNAKHYTKPPIDNIRPHRMLQPACRK